MLSAIGGDHNPTFICKARNAHVVLYATGVDIVYQMLDDWAWTIEPQNSINRVNERSTDVLVK